MAAKQPTVSTPAITPATAVADGAATGAAPSDATGLADTPTPENTPVPGGGRWRWDITKPGWVDPDAVATDQAPAQ